MMSEPLLVWVPKILQEEIIEKPRLDINLDSLDLNFSKFASLPSYYQESACNLIPDKNLGQVYAELYQKEPNINQS